MVSANTYSGANGAGMVSLGGAATGGTMAQLAATSQTVTTSTWASGTVTTPSITLPPTQVSTASSTSVDDKTQLAAQIAQQTQVEVMSLSNFDHARFQTFFLIKKNVTLKSPLAGLNFVHLLSKLTKTIINFFTGRSRTSSGSGFYRSANRSCYSYGCCPSKFLPISFNSSCSAFNSTYSWTWTGLDDLIMYLYLFLMCFFFSGSSHFANST